MIECTNAKLMKRRNRKRSKKRFLSFFIVVVTVAALFLYSKFFIAKNIADICADYTYSYSAASVNKAVLGAFSGGVTYSDIIEIEKNNTGDITLMSANMVEVNSISQKIVTSAKNNLENMLDAGIPIPWLAFSGIKLLAGYGSDVAFKTVTVSSVQCNFDGKFTSVGINQTLHSIYAVITCDVDVDIPFDRRVETYRTEVLISEAVLIGKVPEIYLNGSLFA